MSRSGQPDRGGSALGERPRGQGFSSADLEFDKDVLCVFPRLHLAGAFHLTDFHLFGFYPSPIRTLIAREFSSIFRHSHKFFTFKLVTRSKCSPFSINFHLALVQPNLNSPDKSDFFLANLANYPQRFSFVTKLTRCSAPARAHAMMMNEWARAGCSSRVARKKWKSGENSLSLSRSLLRALHNQRVFRKQVDVNTRLAISHTARASTKTIRWWERESELLCSAHKHKHAREKVRVSKNHYKN